MNFLNAPRTVQLLCKRLDQRYALLTLATLPVIEMRLYSGEPRASAILTIGASMCALTTLWLTAVIVEHVS